MAYLHTHLPVTDETRRQYMLGLLRYLLLGYIFLGGRRRTTDLCLPLNAAVARERSFSTAEVERPPAICQACQLSWNIA